MTTAPEVTPRPPTTVGPVTVAAHMLFGMVGLLVAAAVLLWWFRAEHGPATAPHGLAPGTLRLTGDIEVFEAVALAAALGRSIERASGGSAGYMSGYTGPPLARNVDEPILFTTSTPATAADPQLVAEEFGFELTGALGRPIETLDPSLFASVTGVGMLPLVVRGKATLGTRPLDAHVVPSYRLSYAPPDGGPLVEWRGRVEGSVVRFVR